MQNPHCTAPASTNACCTSDGRAGRRQSSPPIPSTVTIGWPTADGRHHEARAHERAVDEHAARAALALLAGALRAEQPEPLAQHVEQALAEPRVADRPCRSPLTCSTNCSTRSCSPIVAHAPAAPVARVAAPARRPRDGGRRPSSGGRRSVSTPRRPARRIGRRASGGAVIVDQSIAPASHASASGHRSMVGPTEPSASATVPSVGVDDEAGAGDGDHHRVAHADLGVALPAVDGPGSRSRRSARPARWRCA